jgi:uncharacterized membrane protein YgcG
MQTGLHKGADTMSDKTQDKKVARPEPKTAAEMQAMRKSRNYWVLGLIAGLVVLFYLITILRMAGAA